MGERDGASGDAETEGGERAAPRFPCQSPQLVRSVGEGLPALGEGLILCIVVQRCEGANELAQVAGVRAVFGAVLAAEVEHLVDWNGGEIERDLLKVEGNDMARSRQGR